MSNGDNKGTHPAANILTVSGEDKHNPEGQAYYALAILLAAYILSFIDRNIMAVLIGPIRQDLDISDFQYSLLHGFACQRSLAALCMIFCTH